MSFLQTTANSIFNFNEEEKDEGKGHFEEHMPKDSVLYQALKTVLKAKNAKATNPDTYMSPCQLKEDSYGSASAQESTFASPPTRKVESSPYWPLPVWKLCRGKSLIADECSISNLSKVYLFLLLF